MESFKEWLNVQSNQGWKGSKPEILQQWQGITPGLPLAQVRTVPVDHKGSAHNFDNIRVSGSPSFINYVLSRMKDMLRYENDKTRLEVIYRQRVDSKSNQPVPQSYTFGVQVKERGKGRK